MEHRGFRWDSTWHRFQTFVAAGRPHSAVDERRIADRQFRRWGQWNLRLMIVPLAHFVVVLIRPASSAAPFRRFVAAAIAFGIVNVKTVDQPLRPRVRQMSQQEEEKEMEE